MPHTTAPTARSIRVPALLALALVALAGCGGGASKDEYQEQMRGVGADISKASEQVAAMKPDAPAAQRAKTIRAQGALLAKAADKADDVEPPSDASEAHDEFVDALRAYAKILDQLADASASSKNAERQAALLGEAGTEVDRLTAASSDLRDAGYDFDASGGE